MEIDDDIYVELGREKRILGIEVWGASRTILEPIAQTLSRRIREMTAKP